MTKIKPQHINIMQTLAEDETRDGILEWKKEPPKKLTIMLPAGDWTISGLYEYQFAEVGGAMHVVNVSIKMKDPGTLWNALRFAAEVHREVFPDGEHRFFEEAVVDIGNKTIELGMGS